MPQVFCCRAAFQTVILLYALVSEVIPLQGQDLMYSSVDIFLCRTPWGSCWPICWPFFWGSSEWHYKHLVYHPLPPDLHPLQVCWGCPLSLQLGFVALFITLWAWPFSQFSMHQTLLNSDLSISGSPVQSFLQSLKLSPSLPHIWWHPNPEGSLSGFCQEFSNVMQEISCRTTE